MRTIYYTPSPGTGEYLVLVNGVETKWTQQRLDDEMKIDYIVGMETAYQKLTMAQFAKKVMSAPVPIIFENCPNCGKPVGPHNTERISVNELGLWFHHTECRGSGFIKMKELVARSEASAGGNPFKQIAIDYYKQRLQEYEDGLT